MPRKDISLNPNQRSRFPLRIRPRRPRIKNRRQARQRRQTPDHRSGKQQLPLQLPVVKVVLDQEIHRRQRRKETHGHALPVVKFGVRRPSWVVDVCVVPVGDVGGGGEEEVDADEAGAGERHGHCANWFVCSW